MSEKKSSISKLMAVLNFAGSIILMSLLFLICCLPVVTIGQAWCALLTGVRYMIRKDDWFDGFKQGFKTRFWRGIVAWCVMLIPNIYFLSEVNRGYDQVVWHGNMDNLAQLISACIMLALTTMLTTSLLTLNVYVPTKINLWVNNAVSFVFKAPLTLLLSAVLFWLPFLMVLLWLGILAYTVLVFVVAYFPLSGLVSTLALKNALLDVFLSARADGTLLAEEGRMPETRE